MRVDHGENFEFDEHSKDEVQKLWQGRSPIILKARELLRVGREVSVVHLQNRKILMGIAPCCIPPKISNCGRSPESKPILPECTSNPLQIDESTRSVFENMKAGIYEDAVVDGTTTGINETTAGTEVTAGTISEIATRRKIKRSEIFGRDVSCAVERLLVSTRRKLLEGDDSCGDMVLYGRVLPGVQLGIVYAVPAIGTELRRLCIVISMVKGRRCGRKSMACVRYCVNPILHGGRPISEDDVIVDCSCGCESSGGSCTYLEYCQGMKPIVHNILSNSVPAYKSETQNNWRCVRVGPREWRARAISSVIRNNTSAPQDESFILVQESRDAKHLGSTFVGRMRCMSCLRTAANRGTCENEAAVMNSAMRVEGVSPIPG